MERPPETPRTDAPSIPWQDLEIKLRDLGEQPAPLTPDNSSIQREQLADRPHLRLTLLCRYSLTLRKSGKFTFTWRVADGPADFVGRIAPLAVDFSFTFGKLTHLLPEFSDGQTRLAASLRDPIPVFLLRADEAGPPIPFEAPDPVTVDVFGLRNDTEPTGWPTCA